jgi:hypothetical protein
MVPFLVLRLLLLMRAAAGKTAGGGRADYEHAAEGDLAGGLLGWGVGAVAAHILSKQATLLQQALL